MQQIWPVTAILSTNVLMSRYLDSLSAVSSNHLNDRTGVRRSTEQWWFGPSVQAVVKTVAEQNIGIDNELEIDMVWDPPYNAMYVMHAINKD